MSGRLLDGRPAWGGRRAAELTRLVLDRDGHRCRWCGAPATTADHYPIARSAGGPDSLDNLIAACLPCNSSKRAGNRPAGWVPAPPSRPW